MTSRKLTMAAAVIPILNRIVVHDCSAGNLAISKIAVVIAVVIDYLAIHLFIYLSIVLMCGCAAHTMHANLKNWQAAMHICPTILLTQT